MAARHCSGCGTNWPTDQDFRQCPLCKDETSYSNAIQVDEDWEWRLELADLAQKDKDRVRKFQSVGFAYAQAVELVCLGTRLEAAQALVQVRKCPPDLAYEILR